MPTMILSLFSPAPIPDQDQLDSSRKRQKRHHIPSAYHSVIAGAGAGLVSSVATCPLDVVKTRLQAQLVHAGTTGYEGVVETVIRILKQSGIKGMYRGLGPTIMGYLPTWGIYFSVYDEVKQRLGAAKLGGKGPTGNDTWTTHIIAAMTAGATGTIATSPLWVIKTRFMAQAVQVGNERRYKHTWDAVRTIYRQEGVRAFYKGLAPSLMGVSHVAVQFPLYEQLKIWAAPEDNTPLQSQTILLCSALSKMVASLATYPHEVLRTRLQVHRSQHAGARQPVVMAVSAPLINGRSSTVPINPTMVIPRTTFGTTQGMVAEFKSILHQDGWKGFYRGLSINLIRTVPNSAVTMLTYELIMRRLTA